MGVDQGVAGVSVQAIQAVVVQARYQRRQPVFHESQAEGAVFWGHLVSEENHFGGVGIDLNDRVTQLAQPAADFYATVY